MAPQTMKAVDIQNESGPISALYINANTPVPAPRAGEALIKIHAFGLNRADLLQREGKYPLPPQAPKTLGLEVSGEIVALGPPCEPGDASAPLPSAFQSFNVGDHVFGLAYGGGYAQYISVSLRTLIHKPAFLSWTQAAAVPEVYMTATQALFLVGDFARGKTVLWHAGASAVSIAGIQLARDAGASAVYATAGSEEKCRFIRETLGADGAFNYKETEDGKRWDEKILAATGGRGVDLIVDFIGGPYFKQNLRSAARDGRIVLLGFLGGSIVPEKEVDIGALLFKRLRIEGSTLRSRDLHYQGKLTDRLVEYVKDFEPVGTDDDGKGEKVSKLRIFVESVLPMEDIQKAHKLLAESRTMGKVVCTVKHEQ